MLIIPFGVMGGYVSVTLGYLLAQAGVNAQGVAALVAVFFIPQTWKFLWAPLADLTLTRKRWYVLSAALCALGFLGLGAIAPQGKSLPLLSAVAFGASLATTFLAMSVESLMAYGTGEGEKGRAGGWFQAGNLGGYGLGGGAGLWMAQHLPQAWLAAAVLGAACLACCAALAFIPEPPAARRGTTVIASVREVLRDLWTVARSRRGFLALLICFLPIGTGAATNLWAAISADWSASANTVALVTGALGGIASAAGCLVGGYLCDRMDRKTAYWVFGLAQALCAVAMAMSPRTEPMYAVFVTVYWFITGLTYAAFSAVVLEAMGLGAAATKYNLFASLSNTPIAYMTLVDGWAHTQGGAGAMLQAEAAICLTGIVVFMVSAALAHKTSRFP
ncbi:MAG: AmpG family muropeptide MFS transporter [Betaproteobacteria bacterium]|nr:MAG: AmpG family muropeptide MFS transporter [Betaproteobacteria bacterium]